MEIRQMFSDQNQTKRLIAIRQPIRALAFVQSKKFQVDISRQFRQKQ